MSNIVDCNFSQSGEGPGLFLIHGIGAAQDAWRFILPKLSEYFTVITYDLRGHGKSPLAKKKFTLNDFVTKFHFIETNGEMGDDNVLETNINYTFDESVPTE